MIRISVKYKFIYVLILTLLFQTLHFKSAYAQSDDSSKIDAVLLMDASGSMAHSDPKSISFDAVNMFIDMCSAQGDRIGIVAYADKIVKQVPLKEIQSVNDKNSLKSAVASMPKKAATDIGLALKTAVQMMDSGHSGNHKPLIILLSDGKNEPGKNSRTLVQSQADEKEALEIAKYKGYPIYTIGLNADGSVDQNELKHISSSTGAKTFITDSADNLPQILSEIFADHLKLKIVSPGYINGNGEFQDVKINIPDSNVMEANISLLSQKPLEVKLLDNNGKEQAIPSENIIYTRAANYSMIKLIRPEKGDWALKVKGISGDKIKINLIFNYDLKLVMEMSKKDDFSKGDTITISSYFTSSGQKLSDAEVYKGMKGVLSIKDLTEQGEKKIELVNKGDSFDGKFTIEDNHKYEIKVISDAKNFSRESEAVTISAENSPPVVVQSMKDTLIFNGKEKYIDLSKIFSDPDGDPLKYSITTNPPGIPDVKVNGSSILVSSKAIGTAQATITAEDGSGGKAQLNFNIKVKSMAPYTVLGILAVLLLGFLIFGLPIIKRANKRFTGQVAIEIRDLTTNKLSTPQYRRLDTYKGRLTLHQLLQLLPEYQESEKVTFLPGKNDRIILKNSSDSPIEKSGRVVDASKGFELKFNDRITINLSKVPKSISLEYLN